MRRTFLNPSSSSGKREFQSNFACALLNGVFYNIAYAFIGGSTVLPLFVNSLTPSRFIVGLVNTIETAGWPLPQVFVAGFVEHRERKKPLYIHLAIIRSLLLFIIAFSVLLFSSTTGNRFLTLFILLFSVYAIAGGLSGVSFMDIIGKVFNSKARGGLWAWRMGVGGSLAVLAGLIVRWVLMHFAYPLNFGILFMIASLFMSMAFLSFALIQEPITGNPDRPQKPFPLFIREGITTLRRDNRFKMLFLLRICLGLNAMSVPFYIIFMRQYHGLELSTVGLFVSVQTFGAIISNLLWGNLSSKKGNHYVLCLTAAVSMLSPLLILVSYRISPLLVYDLFIFFLLGITIQGVWLGFPNALLDISPDEKQPTYVGFMNTMISPVLFLPAIGGILIDFLSFSTLFTISFTASLFAILFAIKFYRAQKVYTRRLLL
jgi:MFS family permease